MKIKKVWVPFLTIGATLGVVVARAKAPQGPPVTVRIQEGTLQGVVVDGIGTFKGIPFAAPPVGKNRWRAPQPVKPWKGVLYANSYGPLPMQNRAGAIFWAGSFFPKVSEDCLYLNVWTPAKSLTEKLPVMVWIHGGAFVSGTAGSRFYEGADLAKHGVVVVSVSYRLGAFGFFAHPELARESGRGSGNYGLMDQIAGLRWVKRNIAQFGGDDGNVTIFGESAGGSSVGLLAASPEARGLFHKIISESGATFAFTKQNVKVLSDATPRADAEKIGSNFLQALGVSSIAAARELSAADIEKMAEGKEKRLYNAIVDDTIVPDNQCQRFLAGQYNDTPILIGTNSDDGGMFSKPTQAAGIQAKAEALFGEDAKDILAAYPHTTDVEASLASRHVIRDVVFGWPTWKWARLQSQHGKNPAYLYYFDRYSSKTPNGANHGSEVPYVFGINLPTPQDKAFSEQMQTYWTNFAKIGNPNGAGLTHWPTFHEPNAKVLNFGNKGISSQPVPNLSQLKALDRIYSR